MPAPALRKKILLILLVISITALHYLTAGTPYHDVFYRELYFLPILLGAFWFGLTGGLAISLAIALVYGPGAFDGEAIFSFSNFTIILEIILFVSAGGLLGFLTEREKTSQRKLREAESLAVMGRSVSAVAHEMKVPLAAIGGFARQVGRKLPVDSSERRKLEIIAEQASRLETMIRDMLAFARPLELRLEDVEINTLIWEGIALVQETAGQHGVSLRFVPAENGLRTRVDQSRFLHVFLNLLLNAVEASPAGEEVMISSFRRNGSAWLEVADRGLGVAPELRQDIFQPFFTTKKGGTGLGLAISKKIIEAHQGALLVVDREGGGSIFRIELPLIRI